LRYFAHQLSYTKIINFMELNRRIDTFLSLGQRIEQFGQDTLDAHCQQAKAKNPWFTADNIKQSFKGICYMLDGQKLKGWLENYPMRAQQKEKVIGVVMAGNIPMVGFHDFLCVLLAGHSIKAKLSSQDNYLLPILAEELAKIDPEWGHKIEFVEKLDDYDAVIATGSNNSARYFEQYFSKKPHIIRKNRTSVAVINGTETVQEIENLGLDVFSYFGLGCRNVSKLYLPEGYNFKQLVELWSPYQDIIYHNKYANNYDYNKAIYILNKEEFFDGGYFLLKPGQQLASPTAVVHYEYYQNINILAHDLHLMEDNVQCVVSKDNHIKNAEPFGKAQFPEIWQYADGIDTMKFLIGL